MRADITPYRKFILIALIVIFGGLTFYYFSTSLLNLSPATIVTSISLLFLLTIFIAIFAAGVDFATVALTQILISLLLLLILYFQNYSMYFSVIIALIYLALQLYAYLMIYYFERSRLQVTWVPIFRIVWYSLSWFLVFLISSFFVLKLDGEVNSSALVKSFIDKSTPLLQTLNLPLPIELPDPEAKVKDVLLEQISKDKQLKNYFNLEYIKINNETLIQSGLSELNRQFKLNLKGEETVSEAVVLYLQQLWQKLGYRQKLIVKIMVFSSIVAIIQPIFWLMGNILSFAALIFFWLFGKLNLYSKEKEQAVKEKIVI